MTGKARPASLGLNRFDISLDLPINVSSLRDAGLQPHQSVTASSHNWHSCSLVPPKWSTNSSLKHSLATLSGFMNAAVASLNDLASLAPPAVPSPFASGG